MFVRLFRVNRGRKFGLSKHRIRQGRPFGRDNIYTTPPRVAYHIRHASAYLSNGTLHIRRRPHVGTKYFRYVRFFFTTVMLSRFHRRFQDKEYQQFRMHRGQAISGTYHATIVVSGSFLLRFPRRFQHHRRFKSVHIRSGDRHLVHRRTFHLTLVGGGPFHRTTKLCDLSRFPKHVVLFKGSSIHFRLKRSHRIKGACHNPGHIGVFVNIPRGRGRVHFIGSLARHLHRRASTSANATRQDEHFTTGNFCVFPRASSNLVSTTTGDRVGHRLNFFVLTIGEFIAFWSTSKRNRKGAIRHVSFPRPIGCFGVEVRRVLRNL